MKIRKAVLAAAVAAGLTLASACSATPSATFPAGPAAATSAATATVTAVSTALVTITAAPASPREASDSDASMSGSVSGTTLPSAESSDASGTASADPSPADTSTATDDAASTEQSDPGQHPWSTGDAVTTRWVGGICGGMSVVMNQLVDGKPHLADDASVSTLRRAMVDYYALSGKSAAAAYDDAQSLQPPTVADGPAIHQAYEDFVGGLRDIFAQASISMSRAADVPAIEAINDKVDQRITAMGTDNTALKAMSRGQLAALAKAIPACKDVSDTVAGS